MNAKTIELHLLQSFPPSCVNRDGNNSPKDCTFGDVRRARISSQCLKRAIRQADIFADTLGEEVGTRSKLMRDKKLIPYLVEAGLDQKSAETVADNFRKELSKADSKRPQQSAVGLYFGDDELFRLLDAHRVRDPKWKEKASHKSADIALFGRMLAERPELNVDAASQIAHALSTHRLSQEMDYWTAADDLKNSREEGGDSGAGMLGTAEFNASVFYRYACVSLPILGQNLRDLQMVKTTVQAFLLASWDAIPTGKVSGHAHFTPPFLALAVVRKKGMPLNLCNAFLKPVKAVAGTGLDQLSAVALLDHLQRSRSLAPLDEATYYLAHSLPEPLATQAVDGYGTLVKEVLAEL